jgi:hypothetical protein
MGLLLCAKLICGTAINNPKSETPARTSDRLSIEPLMTFTPYDIGGNIDDI